MSTAARHHSLRVYLQVKQWKGENEFMSLDDYGWKVTEQGQVLPRMPDLFFLYLIEQVEFSQLLADVDLLYFQRGQPQHREIHTLLFSNGVWVL